MWSLIIYIYQSWSFIIYYWKKIWSYIFWFGYYRDILTPSPLTWIFIIQTKKFFSLKEWNISHSNKEICLTQTIFLTLWQNLISLCRENESRLWCFPRWCRWWNSRSINFLDLLLSRENAGGHRLSLGREILPTPLRNISHSKRKYQ